MTVIAYRDGVMASDSRETLKYFIADDNSKKLYRLPDGSLFGGSGSSYAIHHLRMLLEDVAKKKKKDGKTHFLPDPKSKSVQAILVSKDGKIWEYNGYWAEVKEDFIASGSGFEVAYGALETGATAVEAVRAAIKRRIECGGRIQTLRLKD